MTNFRLFYYTLDLPEERTAEIDSGKLSEYQANIYLNSRLLDFTTDEEIKEYALHEMLHLLMARYSACANARFISDDELEEAEHEVVNRLQYFISNK